jgi:hypothetical protein
MTGTASGRRFVLSRAFGLHTRRTASRRVKLGALAALERASPSLHHMAGTTARRPPGHPPPPSGLASRSDPLFPDDATSLIHTKRTRLPVRSLAVR